jgi:hypothetical protein
LSAATFVATPSRVHRVRSRVTIAQSPAQHPREAKLMWQVCRQRCFVSFFCPRSYSGHEIGTFNLLVGCFQRKSLDFSLPFHSFPAPSPITPQSGLRPPVSIFPLFLGSEVLHCHHSACIWLVNTQERSKCVLQSNTTGAGGSHL